MVNRYMIKYRKLLIIYIIYINRNNKIFNILTNSIYKYYILTSNNR